MKIDFKGELSPVCKNQLLKRSQKINKILIVTAVCTICNMVLHILSFAYGKYLLRYFGMAMSAVAIVTALIFLISTRQKNGNEAQIFPKQITITEKDIELLSTKDNCFSRKLQDVTKITETKTSYIFDFCLPNDTYYICQKDLLAEGTIDEFEKLFDGKIVKEKLKR